MAIDFPETGGTQDVFYTRPQAVPLPMMTRAEGIRFWGRKGVHRRIVRPHGERARPRQSQRRRRNVAPGPAARLCLYPRGPKPDQPRLRRAAERDGRRRVRTCQFRIGGQRSDDNALKFARQYTLATNQASRCRIISLNPSYHGATIGTLGLAETICCCLSSKDSPWRRVSSRPFAPPAAVTAYS